MRSFRIKIVGAILTAVILTLASCQKDNFDVPAPGANFDPAGIHATMTIQQFKDSFYYPNKTTIRDTPFLIPMHNIILSGIINADDKSGTFYKTLCFQDATGGMILNIEATYLYNDYPIGRRIFVKCDSLYLINYKGTLQLGAYRDYTTTSPSVGGVASTNLTKVITKGKWGLADSIPIKRYNLGSIQYVDPYVVQSTLIQLDSVEFQAGDTASTFADPIGKQFGTLHLEDCQGHIPLEISTSGYAGFAGTKPPKGKGSVKGIFGLYQKYTTGGFRQLTIRDLTDLQLTDSVRCY